MFELLSLKQTGKVCDYHDQFESLLRRVEISEDYAISFFLNGLKNAIQQPVRMFMPRTLNQAYALAHLQETTLKTLQQELTTPNKKPLPPLLPTPRPPLLPTPKQFPKPPQKPNTNLAYPNSRMRPSIDFDDRRSKGLCFWCDEKFVPGHKCHKRQLYVLEVDDEKEMEEEIVDGSGEEVRIEDEDTNPHISVHAISGATAKGYKTMRVTVYVRKKPLHILIDSGSTDNFLDVEVAKKLGCKIEQIGPMRVDVANGSSLACVAVCKGLSWTLQGSQFTTDVLLLPLGNCDMVLGVQWLETLGEIKWDFKQLRMEFEVEEKKLVLRGGASAVELKTVTMEQMDKLLPYSSECSLVQLCSLHLKVNEEFHCFNNGVTLVNENKVPEQIEQLLQKYGFLFKEPTQLPPHRRHDHRIPLKEGVNAVSIRP